MLREWKRIFSIPNFYVVLLVIPPIIFIFYGFIYQKQFAKELPMAVWDEDRSSVSRMLTDMMQQNEYIHFTHTAFSNSEIENLMKKGEIFGAVHFPKNMESDVKKDHQSNITLYTNGAYLVPAKMIYKGAAEVIVKGGLAVVLQKAEKQGMPAEKANTLVQPIKLNTTTLYNPDFNYQMYLTPGLITVGLQMALIVASVLILNLEFKRNTIDELLKISTSSSQIFIGKMFAHLCIAWILFLLVAFLVFPMYHLEKSGTYFNFFIMYTLMSLACIGIGMMVSAISNNLLLVTDIALFFTSPAFVFSGFTFPRTAMPWYDQFYAEIMPYTHFLDGFIKIYFMKLPISYAMPEIYKLLIFIGITFSITILFFQNKVNTYLKNKKV
jgi:ABC-2 type transport system permease protein